MSADVTIPLPARSQNPFEAARLALVKRLLELKAPAAFGSFPIPSDFQNLAGHVLEATAIFDEWLGVIGHQTADNASHNIDMRVFEGAFTGAVDGNATYEIENCAERLIEDRDEQRSMRRRA